MPGAGAMPGGGARGSTGVAGAAGGRVAPGAGAASVDWKSVDEMGTKTMSLTYLIFSRVPSTARILINVPGRSTARPNGSVTSVDLVIMNVVRG